MGAAEVGGWRGGGRVGGKCGGREGWRKPSEVARRSRVATPPHGKLVLAPLQDTLMDGGGRNNVGKGKVGCGGKGSEVKI